MTTTTVTKTEFGRTFTSEVCFDGKLYRWSTNGRIPPADAAREYGIDRLPGFDAVAQAATRADETHAAISEYRAARERFGYSAEEKAEMRAAFGPGAKIVDALTGKTVRV